ncbi:MAG: hypothetical protein IJE70_06325 [Oscillospiraceae bacterium]|nr:hypothetical protein [Oscillospiraceae bacterium]MBQ6902877.1 hypothetical protein [Oscillospiraceae bacterium]
MKRILALSLCFAMILSLSGCYFVPPEGWTRRHHTYREVLDFAKSVDPDATVVNEYTDTVDEYNRKYREWDAVINGVDCHVASVSDSVWNRGFAAGEFTKTFYRIDTDHDYTVFMDMLEAKYPDWKHETDISAKYRRYNQFFPKYILSEYRMLSDTELEKIWQEAFKMKTEFEKIAINRTIVFAVPSPGKYRNHHGEMEDFVRKNSLTYFDDFTEEGKQVFFQDYHDAWELLKSDLPIYD